MNAGGHTAVRRRLRRTLGAGLMLVLLLTGFIDVTALVVPIYDMQLYDRVLQSQNMDTLTLLSVACAVGLLLFGALEFLRSSCLLAVGEAVGRHLNGAVLHQTVHRAAAGDAKAGPEMMRDLNELQSFMSSGAVTAPLDALFTPLFLLVMAMLHPAFAYIAVIGVSLLVLANLGAEYLVRPALLAANESRADAGRVLSRSLVDPELADGLGMLPAMARRWAAQDGQALVRLQRASGRALGMTGLSRVIRLAVQGGNMAVGALLVLAGATTPGCLMGANLLVNKTLGPFDHLTRSWRHWMLAHAAWRRIDGLLRSAPEAETVRRATAGDSHPGLAVDGLTLRAPDGRELLHGIDLRIRPGTLAVLTGPNGSGKTTLLRMLAGLTPPTSGAVLLDGAPVGPGVGYLPQSVSLLEGTLAENIGRFGADGLALAVDAARRADVHEPIGRLQRGYDMPLSGNGAMLSGGMRQRVGLARALCGAPRLLLLDEPDASLDGEGGAALVRALRAECATGAIAVVISHRPGLRAAADLVLTLRAGRLTAADAAASPASKRLATA